MECFEQVWSKLDDDLVFYVNGKKVTEKHPDPNTSLLAYLRDKLRLTGTKTGCGEGGCGACTVMVSKWDTRERVIKHYSVNSCLIRVVSLHDCAVTTVEGIGSKKTKLHAVQERLSKFYGTQCGFCTPGMVMSMYTLLRNKTVPSLKDIEKSLQGNLCRCTGYRPILSAFSTFTDPNSGCPLGEDCCQNNVPTECSQLAHSDTQLKFVSLHVSLESEGNITNLTTNVSFAQYDPTQEVIFPPKLLISSKEAAPYPLKFVGENVTWYRPITLAQLTCLKAKYPEAPLVAGNTIIGVETWVKGHCHPILISTTGVTELNFLTSDSKGVTIGSSCTFTQIQEEFEKIIEANSATLTQPMSAILEMLQLFGGDQIRNVGTIGGNIMSAYPTSDLNPILMVCGCEAKFVHNSNGERTTFIDESFFPKHKATSALKDEVLISIWLPFTEENEYLRAYRQTKRRSDNIDGVNAALRVQFYPDTKNVKKFVAAFGAMETSIITPLQTMSKIIDRDWNEELLNDAITWLGEDISLSGNNLGRMTKYRETLATSFFFKFFIDVTNYLAQNEVISEKISDSEKSTLSALNLKTTTSFGTQTWQEVPKDQPADDVVGRPLKHVSADLHVTGEASFLDDVSPYTDELYLGLVTSTRAHANIKNINLDAAESSPGYVTWVDHHDIPGTNDLGPFGDVFAQNKVTCVGHVIGGVVADSVVHARAAARLVNIEYEDIDPRIITIEDAIEHQSFYEPTYKLANGDADSAMESCDHVIEGEFRIGGQEHFYMETQGCLAVPKIEDDEMDILVSTQNITMVQEFAARVLDIPSNKIKAKVKRTGGAFGGKDTKSLIVSMPVVVAAQKCGKPVRCTLTRQEDMLITGGNHPFLSKYKVGFMKDGKVAALVNEFYTNAGNTLDISPVTLYRAMLHSTNCYRVPNVFLRGYMCRTNITSNTAFRGFGVAHGMLLAEEVTTQVSAFLKITPEEVRATNIYQEKDITISNTKLDSCNAGICWKECLSKSNFDERRQLIKSYNFKNRWKKRGIACVPTQFGVSFAPAFFFHQAGALVHIYKDGSVLLTHGGIELGQRLHTKMIQVASRCLDLPVSLIHISETSTNTVPNASSTAASSSSDINGMAVKNACEKIMDRLKPLKNENSQLSWKELVMKAYMERISLSATGFYKTPGLDGVWNIENGKTEGKLFMYYSYGAAVSEVEIDCLTGEHIVLQTDIVMDVGKSINPAIDIGQIEGAFTQGYGLFTTEEPLYSSDGNLLTRGPSTYKIPQFSDCPRKFNIHLLRNSVNKDAIYSSKGIGEPPLFLASSVFFAIKNAIEFARKDSGILGRFRLDSPATSARVRMACGDVFHKQTKPGTVQFGASQPTTTPAGAFSFGSSNTQITSQPATGFYFASSSQSQPAFSSNPSGTVQFGASQPTTTPAGGFSFGSSNTQIASQPATGFYFANSSQSQPAFSSNPSGTVQFGASQPTTTPAGAFSFGSSNTQIPSQPATGFYFASSSQSQPAFSSNPSGTVQFGASQPTTTPAGEFSFGSSNTQITSQPATGFYFASSSQSQPAFSSNPSGTVQFGASQPTTTPAGGFSFGSSNTQIASQPATGFYFASSSQSQPAFSSNPSGTVQFGASQPTTTPAGAFSFGSSNTQIASQPATGFYFASSSQSQPAFSSNPSGTVQFGASQPTTTPAGGFSFGSSNTQIASQPATGFYFANSSQSQPAFSSNPSGTVQSGASQPTTTLAGAFSFGSSNTQIASQPATGFKFASSSQSQPAFSSNPSGTVQFGASQPTTTPAGAFSFGSSNTQIASQPATGFYFANSSQSQPAFSSNPSGTVQFGASQPTTTPAGGFSFGSSNTQIASQPATGFKFASSSQSQPAFSSNPSGTFQFGASAVNQQQPQLSSSASGFQFNSQSQPFTGFRTSTTVANRSAGTIFNIGRSGENGRASTPVLPMRRTTSRLRK